MSDLLEVLPPRWREDRMMLADRPRWDAMEVHGDGDGLVLVFPGRRGPVLLGRGDPGTVGRVLEQIDVGHVGWLSVPRGCDVAPDVLARLGLVPYSTWDWLSSSTPPPVSDAEAAVVRLDPGADADAIRGCLAVANPSTSADPTAPDEAGWWGIRVDGRLAGVVGAAVRGGPDAGHSWHVHGLGVVPELRGTGSGTALAAAVTRAGLASGAAWVSLGMYADNDVARRIYERLGYRVDARFTSFSPRGATRPPG
ncbi:GNAT family N-acetyltransferase [Cellulomonas xylanilytica]|uniref:N-acetyltransferase domain-containing protein n=1 Tax=Cellulomonas xylanilytica TaxID=233583 RepID=A0A510V293_9CELL|nr:GNAT family N-acetyltransferase [Cellulomonas xylanilytica]GEK19951.1 hypothetical protein CXY01_04710 [Cellulomonas xylanilytica]